MAVKYASIGLIEDFVDKKRVSVYYPFTSMGHMLCLPQDATNLLCYK